MAQIINLMKGGGNGAMWLSRTAETLVCVFVHNVKGEVPTWNLKALLVSFIKL
jgi:hypothetical protein